MLALMLLLGGVLIIGLAVDVTRLIATWRETSHLAHTAAETGAGWVQSEPLYRGELSIDPISAETAAREVASGATRSVEVDAGLTLVCVTVHQEVAPGITRLAGAAPKAVSATACASPRRG